MTSPGAKGNNPTGHWEADSKSLRPHISMIDPDTAHTPTSVTTNNQMLNPNNKIYTRCLQNMTGGYNFVIYMYKY